MEEHLEKYKKIEGIRESLGWSSRRLYEVISEAMLVDECDELEGQERSLRTVSTVKKQFQRKSKTAPLDYYLSLLNRDPEVQKKLGLVPVLLKSELNTDLQKALIETSKFLTDELNKDREV